MSWRSAFRLVAKHEALAELRKAELVLLIVDPAAPATGQIDFMADVIGWTPRFGEAVSEWTEIFRALDELSFGNPGRPPVQLEAWDRAAEKKPKPKRRMA